MRKLKSSCTQWLAAIGLAAGLATAPSAQAALLGLNGTFEYPLAEFDSPVPLGMGGVRYDPATDAFTVTAVPSIITFSAGDARFIGPPTGGDESLSVNVVVNASGEFVDGVAGDDIVLVGAFGSGPSGVPAFDGVLLTGEVTAFGFVDSGSNDAYDFEFTVTGGELAEAYGGIGATAGLAINLSEGSTFENDFTELFGGGAKGAIGALPVTPEPAIQLCKLVSLTGGVPFFDADKVAGDGCDALNQTIPVGLLGADATYQFIVKNTGTETLVDAVINDSMLGLLNVPVPGGPLLPGQERVIESGDAGFDSMVFVDRCTVAGQEEVNDARVDATGETSKIPVSDDDPARVRCEEPAIKIVKKVSLNGVDFFDANDRYDIDVPVGAIGADATYQFTVTNIGTETLTNVVITDSMLGLDNVPVPGGDLAPWEERVITSASQKFATLDVTKLCDAIGVKTNIAEVDAEGFFTGTLVEDADPANVRCEDPQILLKKQVSLTGGEPFFDADAAGDADVPVGALGADATYRLIVENIGSETLIDITISDSTLGLMNVVVPGGPLLPTAIRIIESGHAGFTKLAATGRCDELGNLLNLATVDAVGDESGNLVSDDDPANVRCITGPAIQIIKQVSLTGGEPFFDADNPGDADVPSGALGADATYRLIVKNIGDEVLVNAVINDPTVGLFNVPVPGGNLAPDDERVIDAGPVGSDFEKLHYPNRCNSVGNQGNTAFVMANGMDTNIPVNDDDPANVDCVVPVLCAISVDKRCALPPPPPSGDMLCETKIKATTWRYIGPTRLNATVFIEGTNNGSVEYAGIDLIKDVTILTDAGQNGYTIDAEADGGALELGSKTNVTINGVLEIIHTSCSAIYSAGAPAPLDGGTPFPADSSKGDPSPNWFVVNFEDKNGGFVEIPNPQPVEGADSCELPNGNGVLCTERPTKLSLRFNGGDCAQSVNSQSSDKWECTDLVAGGAGAGPVRIRAVNGSDVYFDHSGIEVGDVIDMLASTVGRSDFDSELDITIFNAANDPVQTINMHTSCSQDLAIGNRFGSMEVFGFVNSEQGEVEAGTEVNYLYKITNTGTTDVIVTSVFDDKLDELLAPDTRAIAAGEMVTLEQSALIDQETMNQVLVLANVDGDPSVDCSATDFVVVTIAPAPVVPLTCSDLKPIKSLSMVWNGPSGLNVTGPGGQLFENVQMGNRITFDAAGFGNDVDLTLRDPATGSIIGMSQFHVSCSDSEMNGSDSCGMPQGNGKGNDPDLVNDWSLDGMAGTSQSFDCGLPNTGVVEPTPDGGGSSGGGMVTGAPTLDLGDDKKVKWDLTNNGSGDATIVSVEISWPNTHGKLKKFKLDGDTFADKVDDTSSPTSVSAPDFHSDEQRRQITAGDTVELRVEFDDDVSDRVPSDFSITVTFANGDVVSFN